MSEIKLNIEATSIQELIEDFTTALEELGCFIVKGKGEIPEELKEFFLSRGMYLYIPGENIPENLINALIKEEEDEVIDTLLDNEAIVEKIVQRLEEKGYKIQSPLEE